MNSHNRGEKLAEMILKATERSGLFPSTDIQTPLSATYLPSLIRSSWESKYMVCRVPAPTS